MIVDTSDIFVKARVYPHAYEKLTIDTFGDRLTITKDGVVFWDGKRVTREEATTYLRNMTIAFDHAFEIATVNP